MIQAIQAQYKDNFRAELTSGNSEFISIMRKLQFIFDNEIYTDKIRYFDKTRAKNGMFSVLFNYNSNFDFIDIVEEVYDNYTFQEAEKRKLEVEFKYERESREKSFSDYMSQNDLSNRSLESIENEIGSIDPEFVRYEIKLKRSQITSSYMEILNAITQELIVEIEKEIDISDSTRFHNVLNNRLKEARKGIDKQWEEALAKHEKSTKSFFGY